MPDKKKQNVKTDEEWGDLEDLLEMPREIPVNKIPSVFDKGINEKTGGINTIPSVFDKDVIFKTS